MYLLAIVRFWSVFVFLNAAAIAAESAHREDWPMIGGSSQEQFFSPLAQINLKTIGRLGLAWFQELETRRGVEATPLVQDGVMYNILPWNVTTAMDARSGKLLWRYDPQVPRETARLACCDIVTRGLALWNGKVIIATLDGRLMALNAKTGQPLWSVQTLEPGAPYTITGAPRVFDGKVFIGNGGADYGVRGYVSAYDAESGHLIWRFYTVPDEPAKGTNSAILAKAAETWSGAWWKLGGGGTVWDAITYDPDLRMIYIGVGNGSPWVQKFRSPGGGDNLFLCSIVALNADTGEYVWHFQETPAEQFDYTATQPMVLADLNVRGRLRKVLMQAPKNGFFYVLDRVTGELISARNIVDVNWTTGLDPKTGRPTFSAEARYDQKPVLLAPAFNGAHNWQPMSFSPLTGLVYIPVTQNYGVYSAAEEFTYQKNSVNPGLGDPAERRALQDEAVSRERSWLSAWNPVTQTEAWRVTYPKSGSGGTLSTAGGLVFQGTINKTLAAYRDDTGEKVWELPVDNIPIAAPMTYMAAGKQYIAVNAGYGGARAHSEAEAGMSPHISSARLLVFTIGGKGRLPALAPRSPIPLPTRVFMSDEDLQTGRQLYVTYCQSCHGTSVRGGVKDLRHMTTETRAAFADIVLKGTRSDQGMASFDDVLTPKDASTLLRYIGLRAYEDSNAN